MIIWRWLQDPKNQTTLGFIGAGVAGLLAVLAQLGVLGSSGNQQTSDTGRNDADSGGTTVTIGVGGTGHHVTAAGRDQYIGIPPDQLPAILAASREDWSDLTDEQRATISALEGKLGGVSQKAVLAFFKAIDETQVPLDQLEGRLAEIAETYGRALAQAAAVPGDTPEIAVLKNDVRAALEAGELARADKLLEQILQLEDMAIGKRHAQAAKTAAQRGNLALTQLRYPEAAEHFRSAARRIPNAEAEDAFRYIDSAAEALYRQGAEFGDNAALEDAISHYRLLLTMRTRERVPLGWAATQNNLGNALRTLGGREAGTARLEEAVQAYRAALEERTRERVPLGWAATQNNLGNALQTLGGREEGTVRLEEAVQAYSAVVDAFQTETSAPHASIARKRLADAETMIATRRGL